MIEYGCGYGCWSFGGGDDAGKGVGNGVSFGFGAGNWRNFDGQGSGSFIADLSGFGTGYYGYLDEDDDVKLREIFGLDDE